MLKRLILALFMATPAMAQTSFFTDKALQQVNVTGTPTPLTAAIPYGSVRVCGLPLTQQSPCLPLASITDVNGNPVSNAIGPLFGQLTTDATGRFTFGCTNNVTYQVQVTQSASNTPAVNYPVTCPGGVGASVSANNTFTGSNSFINLTATGTSTLCKGKSTAYVDAANTCGWTAPFVQSAINSLPVGGGTVTLNCGDTFTGPTSIPSGVRIASTCLGNLGVYAPNYTTKLTYTSSLTIAGVQGIELSRVHLDFTGAASINLTLSSVQRSVFNFSVDCTNATQPTNCLVLTSTNAGGNMAFNDFPYWSINGGSTALQCTGVVSPAGITTDNRFGLGFINQTLATIHAAISIVQQCDSNKFDAIFAQGSGVTTGNLLIINDSGTPASDTDADNNIFDFLSYTSGAQLTGTALTINNSTGNYIRDGFGINSNFTTTLSVTNGANYVRHSLNGSTSYAKFLGILNTANNTVSNIQVPAGAGAISYIMGTGLSTQNVVVDSAVQTITNKQTVIANGGTAAATGNVTLSAGWGTTASTTAANGFTQHARYTISSSGTGQAANPTIQVTLPQALPAATTLCTLIQVGGTQTFAMINETTPHQAAPTFTYAGTPVAGNTVIVDLICGP